MVSEAVKVWTRVAALSFDGPACQIAVMYRIVVSCATTTVILFCRFIAR
ncbi:Hypothetical protein NGAL_HAMBI2605_28430 [Neorhizobium galegae bv. orientalis]|nr:hypothetical protein LZK73_34210 [Neorhizobium galegae]CDZ56703.1 Hypothetical protein NGAL_HAMBI2566_12540 [Neorhizobium galegae bv. orientalis]CDZ64175.1 Hypothetical protein NGAL_HAMBI2605_28430 [Neorhizobium galegae bv. orientalis]